MSLPRCPTCNTHTLNGMCMDETCTESYENAEHRRTEHMKWIDFDPSLADRQPLPPVKRYVLVRTWTGEARRGPPAIAVGYVKFAAGCADSPFFVIPSVGGRAFAWCDCLGEEAQERGALWPLSV